jgi:hypothetical protein
MTWATDWNEFRHSVQTSGSWGTPAQIAYAITRKRLNYHGSTICWAYSCVRRIRLLQWQGFRAIHPTRDRCAQCWSSIVKLVADSELSICPDSPCNSAIFRCSFPRHWRHSWPCRRMESAMFCNPLYIIVYIRPPLIIPITTLPCCIGTSFKREHALIAARPTLAVHHPAAFPQFPNYVFFFCSHRLCAHAIKAKLPQYER